MTLSCQDSLNFKCKLFNELLQQGIWQTILLAFQSNSFLARNCKIQENIYLSQTNHLKVRQTKECLKFSSKFPLKLQIFIGLSLPAWPHPAHLLQTLGQRAAHFNGLSLRAHIQLFLFLTSVPKTFIFLTDCTVVTRVNRNPGDHDVPGIRTWQAVSTHRRWIFPRQLSVITNTTSCSFVLPYNCHLF